MKKARIAVLVSGGGTNLQALIDAEKSGKIPSGTLSVVIASKPGVYALERADQAGIPALAVSRKASGSQAAFEQQLLDILESYRIDMIVLAGFLSILSKDFTDRYPQRIINIHPSLIPSFCGVGMYGHHVHEAVIRAGATTVNIPDTDKTIGNEPSTGDSTNPALMTVIMLMSLLALTGLSIKRKKNIER